MRERLEALVLEMRRHGILYTEGVREFKKVFICTVLRANNGNQVKSARQMGLHRNTLEAHNFRAAHRHRVGYVHPAYVGRRDPNVKFLRVRRNTCPKSARGALRAPFRKNKSEERVPNSSPSPHFSDHPTASRSHFQQPAISRAFSRICLRRSTLMHRGLRSLLHKRGKSPAGHHQEITRLEKR